MASVPLPAIPLLLLESFDQRVPFFRGQPVGLLGAVRQVEEHHDSQRYRGQPLAQEEPLPALEPGYPVQVLHDRRVLAKWRRL